MSCSCSSDPKDSRLLNGVQNISLDLFNRTSYLTSPYAIGPPLSTYTPSSALSVSPVQGCGGYSFVSPALGPAAPLGIGLAGASPLGGPISPAVGISTSGLPAISTGAPVISVPGANMSSGQTFNLSSGQNVNVGSGTTLNVPGGTTTISVNPNGGSVLNAPMQGSSFTVQRSTPQSTDTNVVVGVPSSARNLMRATGNDTTSNVCTTGCDGDQSFSAPVQTIVNNPPPPVPIGPGVVAGGVGGIALASPAFLGGTPNINVTSGIAFGNDCGANYGLGNPLAIPGPVAPPVNVLGSNYLNNFASQPYYSGLNNSEPAALMNSANPLYPGFVMLARAWNGTPQVIISKPDKNGCPTFENICPFERHENECGCPTCSSFCIDEKEYRCINGFGEVIPSAAGSSLVISPLGTATTRTVAEREFYFVLQPKTLGSVSSPLACRNTTNFTISVNGTPNRNILMYKGCTYTIRFSVDTASFSEDERILALTKRLIFTNDPAGKDGAATDCTTSLIDCNFSPGVIGLQVGQKFSYTPTCDCHSSCLSTIYYQLSDVAYAGGPITIL